MSNFLSETAKKLTPYTPGEQPRRVNLIKLNTNENPYPPAPQVIAAAKQAACERLRLYPDPESSALAEAIAARHGVRRENVFIGNGSDEVLAHMFAAFFAGEKVQFPDVTYSFYPVYASLYGAEYKCVPLRGDFSIDVSDYAPGYRGILLSNPNAPTGMAIGASAIKKLCEDMPDTLIAVDEAYVEFGAQSCVGFINENKNLLVIKTMSKSHSLAGLRVGFAIGDSQLIAGLSRIKNSFNSYPLDRVAQAAAAEAMRCVGYYDDVTSKITASRDWLTVRLRELGFTVLDSSANFVFASHKKIPAREIFEYLKNRDIFVRYFDLPRIDNFLRITIGTQRQCEALVEVLGTMGLRPKPRQRD